VLIAPSFADIFYNNCCQTGLLPVRLTVAEVTELIRRTERSVHGYELTVDLERQRVTGVNGFEARFEIDGYRREMLLRGLDEIGKTLLDERLISAFESRREAGPGRLS
jgi:3-isopropylmalate/(R)-2-methylmalate dehydratase small subunit